MSTSKTGKHGHAKANFTATDIFTGKKLEDVIPSTHTTSVPVVRRNEYQLLDISDDGFCSLLTGEERREERDRLLFAVTRINGTVQRFAFCWRKGPKVCRLLLYNCVLLHGFTTLLTSTR